MLTLDTANRAHATARDMYCPRRSHIKLHPEVVAAPAAPSVWPYTDLTDASARRLPPLLGPPPSAPPSASISAQGLHLPNHTCRVHPLLCAEGRPAPSSCTKETIYRVHSETTVHTLGVAIVGEGWMSKQCNFARPPQVRPAARNPVKQSTWVTNGLGNTQLHQTSSQDPSGSTSQRLLPDGWAAASVDSLTLRSMAGGKA